MEENGWCRQCWRRRAVSGVPPHWLWGSVRHWSTYWPCFPGTPKLAVPRPGRAGWGRVRYDGERPPVEWICVPGLPVCVPCAEGSRRQGGRLPELPAAHEDPDCGGCAAAVVGPAATASGGGSGGGRGIAKIEKASPQQKGGGHGEPLVGAAFEFLPRRAK